MEASFRREPRLSSQLQYCLALKFANLGNGETARPV